MRIAMLGHKRIPSREGGVEIVVIISSFIEVMKVFRNVLKRNKKSHHADA